MIFYLGTHHPHWLRDERFRDVPLFVSRRTLARYKRLPCAVGSWSCDSGGFTELSMHGRWTVPAATYARDVLRFRAEIGGMAWAAPQDWMCEPWITRKTGLTVEEHQRRTIDSVLELRALGAPVIPVLQGWRVSDYHGHVEAYDRAGIDLRAESVVGLGSVCRRQATDEAARLVRSLASLGIALHGFGFKSDGLRAVHEHLASADSLAWSFGARRSPPLPGCVGKHKSCANCAVYALRWRERLLASLRHKPAQLTLFSEVA